MLEINHKGYNTYSKVGRNVNSWLETLSRFNVNYVYASETKTRHVKGHIYIVYEQCTNTRLLKYDQSKPLILPGTIFRNRAKLVRNRAKLVRNHMRFDVNYGQLCSIII